MGENKSHRQPLRHSQQLTEYHLPDVSVTCPQRDKAARDAKRDPVVLVEVLSSATQDLAVKTDSCRKSDSLQAYLIINPSEVWANLYGRLRSTTKGKWLPDWAFTGSQPGAVVDSRL